MAPNSWSLPLQLQQVPDDFRAQGQSQDHFSVWMSSPMLLMSVWLMSVVRTCFDLDLLPGTLVSSALRAVSESPVRRTAPATRLCGHWGS